jgi:hypothetical protein
MAGVGHDLASLAATTSKQADYRGLSMNDGRIDIAKVQALEAPLASVTDGLNRAQSQTSGVGSQWLAGPLHERFDTLQGQLDDAARESTTALAGLSSPTTHGTRPGRTESCFSRTG